MSRSWSSSFQNTGTAAYTNPGYFVALGSAAPIHHNDLPNYTRVTWCIDGKTEIDRRQLVRGAELSVHRHAETRRASNSSTRKSTARSGSA